MCLTLPFDIFYKGLGKGLKSYKSVDFAKPSRPHLAVVLAFWNKFVKEKLYLSWLETVYDYFGEDTIYWEEQSTKYPHKLANIPIIRKAVEQKYCVSL